MQFKKKLPFIWTTIYLFTLYNMWPFVSCCGAVAAAAAGCPIFLAALLQIGRAYTADRPHTSQLSTNCSVTDPATGGQLINWLIIDDWLIMRKISMLSIIQMMMMIMMIMIMVMMMMMTMAMPMLILMMMCKWLPSIDLIWSKLLEKTVTNIFFSFITQE